MEASMLADRTNALVLESVIRLVSNLGSTTSCCSLFDPVTDFS